MALAESDLKGARESIQQALALVEKTEMRSRRGRSTPPRGVVPTPEGTQNRGNKSPAREASILKIADSFDSDNLFAQLFSPQFPSAESGRKSREQA